MKIEKNMKQVLFKDVEPGDCFMYKGFAYICGWFYEGREGETAQRGVELDSGFIRCFEDDEVVDLVDAKVVIE